MKEMNNSIEKGVKQAVKNCLKVKKGEIVVIITDRETMGIANIIRGVAESITKDVYFFTMEDFGRRPLNFPDEIGKVLAKADVSFYIVQGFPGEFQTFRTPLLKKTEANKKLRHGHMVNITSEIMKSGMCSDYREVQRISRLVYEKVKKASQIKVTTSKGTDITAKFSQNICWKNSDGNITAEDWSNLPDGEVFTSPNRVDGKVVIDGCLGDYFTEKYGSLRETPLSVEIENGWAKKESIHCDNEALKKEFIKYLFETDENSSRVGEFAIGTNVGLTKLVGNLLQDEKFPGVHIAFGSPYPTQTGANWDSEGHLDGVMKNTTIYVEDEKIMNNGHFLF